MPFRSTRIRCYICLQWRRGLRTPQKLGCRCTLRAHTTCLQTYVVSVKSLKCPVCCSVVSPRIQKAFALPLIDQLTQDLTDLPQSSYRERATVLRYISRLYTLKNRFEEAQEAKNLADREGYYGCVAYALAKAERTLDPSDAMLALHLALNIDPSHRLAHWANILFFATKPESTFV